MLSEEDKKILENADRIRRRMNAEKREEGDALLSSLRKHAEESAGKMQEPQYGSDEPDYNGSDETETVERTVRAAEGRSGRKRTYLPDEPEETDAETETAPEPVRKRKKKRHHPVRNLLIFILILVLILFGAGVYMGGEVDYEPHAAIAEDAAWDLPGAYEKGVFNILLIGTDARSTDEDSRSDCMILVSICPLQHKIYLNSILRDCYVDIPGIGQNRINHAYQMGGVKLLEETIEQNFHVRIDRYAKVDFFSFVDIIDALGGIDITVTDGEALYVSGYLAEINTLLGIPVGDGCIYEAGTYTFNGRQALSYARIRYIGTDFGRTERQRTVIKAVLTKMRKNPVNAVKAIQTTLANITTDLKRTDIGLLMIRAPFLLTYRIEGDQVPFDGTWANALTPSGQEVLSLDFDAIRAQLRSSIYGK